jgi:RHS repeat-associated protein
LEWNAYGKVRQVTTSTATMTFGYDAQQNRLKKTVNGVTSYYIRDAQGNTLAVYERNGSSLKWKEQDLYGSSRLGMAKPEREVTGFFWASAAYTLVAGAKSYELSNHLGNVMAVISDRGELQSAQDYFPFGMAMPGRSTLEKHRYGFNGKETDPETGLNDFGARLYDNRLGRWLAIDPLADKFPYISPYNALNNNPIVYIDPDGKNAIITVNKKAGTVHIQSNIHYSNSDLEKSAKGKIANQSKIPSDEFVGELEKRFNGMGNRTVNINGKKYTVTQSVTLICHDTDEERNQAAYDNDDDMLLFNMTTLANASYEERKVAPIKDNGNAIKTAGTYRFPYVDNTVQKDSKTALHEFFHSLGLNHSDSNITSGDEQIKNKDEKHGKEGNLMSYATLRTLSDTEIIKAIQPAIELADKKKYNTVVVKMNFIWDDSKSKNVPNYYIDKQSTIEKNKQKK